MSNEENLKTKTIRGFKWSFFDNIGRNAGQFVIGIILTRLLNPGDFGLVGMLTIFIVIGQSLTNSGFGQALIQKKDANNIDFSTVFYFNILASILIYLLFVLAAPLIARFFNESQLVILTKVICLSFVFNAFGLIHIIYFEKNLEFKAPSLIGVLSVAISGGIGIVLALKGFGVWSLVIYTILRSFIATVLLWKISKWKPVLKFSTKSLQSLFGYGSKILVAGLVQSFFQNIYYLIIGRYFPTQSLGYFTRATQFKDTPLNMIKSSVQKVTFPVFSAIQKNDAKLIPGYIKVLRIVSACILPLMVLIIISSEPLIKLVLGAKWLPVVPYLQLMCVYGWVYVLITLNNQLITIKGKSDYYLSIQIIDKVLIVLSILLTYKFGIMAMIYGHMAATILTYIVGCFFLKKVIDISILYQLKNVSPFFLAAILMLGSGFVLSKVFSNDLLYLATSISLGISAYILVLWIAGVAELKIATGWIKKQINEYGLLAYQQSNS